MNKELIYDKLYEIISQLNKRKITHRNFYSVLLLENIYPFYDWNGRTCEILFASNIKWTVTILTRLQEQSRDYYRNFSEEEKDNVQGIDSRTCLMRKKQKRK